MTTDTDAGAVALALGGIALEATAWALRAVLVPALALVLTLAGYRPSGRPQQAPEAPTGAAEQQHRPKVTKTRKRASKTSRATTKTKTTTTAAVAA